MSEGRRKGILPLVVVLVGVLILAAGMLMVWRDKARTPVENSQAGETDIPYPLIDRVSPAQAKRALDAGDALVVDVRDAGSYADRHVSGALNLPLSELPDRVSELDSGRWIITYCT